MRCTLLWSALAVSSITLIDPTHARAETQADSEAPVAPEPVVDSAGSQMTTTATTRATLPKQRFLVRAAVEVDLSTEQAGDSISISPDIWYGIDDKITVGLVHSTSGATGLMGPFGSSLCVAGDGCGDVYNGFGIAGRYHLKDGASYSIAAAGGIYALEFDPFQLGLQLGVVGRYRPKPVPKLAIDAQPSILIGLTEREPAMDGMIMLEGNKEIVTLPVTAWYSVIDKLSLGLQVAFVTPLEGAGESFVLPISLGASYRVNERIVVDLAFSLLSVAGGSEVEATGVDARSLTIGGSYAL